MGKEDGRRRRFSNSTTSAAAATLKLLYYLRHNIKRLASCARGVLARRLVGLFCADLFDG